MKTFENLIQNECYNKYIKKPLEADFLHYLTHYHEFIDAAIKFILKHYTKDQVEYFKLKENITSSFKPPSPNKDGFVIYIGGISYVKLCVAYKLKEDIKDNCPDLPEQWYQFKHFSDNVVIEKE